MADRAVIEAAARRLVDWSILQARMREIVRRPWAIIGNMRVPDSDVVWHWPEGLR